MAAGNRDLPLREKIPILQRPTEKAHALDQAPSLETVRMAAVLR